MRHNNRQSNAFSLMSSTRFGSEYLKQSGNDDIDIGDNQTDYDENNEMLNNNEHGDGGVEAFLMKASTMRESDEVDDTKSQRSATNLAPFKKDLGNRFSTIRPDTRESWLSANPLAKSAASRLGTKTTVYEDLDESRDS